MGHPVSQGSAMSVWRESVRYAFVFFPKMAYSFTLWQHFYPIIPLRSLWWHIWGFFLTTVLWGRLSWGTVPSCPWSSCDIFCSSHFRNWQPWYIGSHDMAELEGIKACKFHYSIYPPISGHCCELISFLTALSSTKRSWNVVLLSWAQCISSFMTSGSVSGPELQPPLLDLAHGKTEGRL